MTQKQIILNYLEALGDWVEEYKVRALNTEWGFIGARGDRDVRDLIKSGLVAKDMRGKYRMVKYLPPIEVKPEEKKEEKILHPLFPSYSKLNENSKRWTL